MSFLIVPCQEGLHSPESDDHFVIGISIIELGDAEHNLLFATDYPHWDYDDPAQVVRRLPKDIRDRVFFENAIELFDLPRTRKA